MLIEVLKVGENESTVFGKTEIDLKNFVLKNAAEFVQLKFEDQSDVKNISFIIEMISQNIDLTRNKTVTMPSEEETGASTNNMDLEQINSLKKEIEELKKSNQQLKDENEEVNNKFDA